MKQTTAEWVAKAEGDFAVMERECQVTVCPNYDAVCFHAQQCAEKDLKALLTFLSIDFPKIHDIGELSALLPSDLRPPLTVEEQERLTDYAVEARYPGVWEPITRTEAEAAVAAARRVREAIRPNLPGEPF